MYLNMKIFEPIPETANWLHFDMKGSIPAADDFADHITFARKCGYNGIVLEYENRIDWKTFPGIAKKPFTSDELNKILNRCRQEKMEVIPLIQTLGHLEWLLKNEKYRQFRENNSVSELCPSNPEIYELLCQWIDEILQLHPGCRFIHIGGDEPFHLASCPKCRKRCENDPKGKLAIYLEHISKICNFVLSRGIRPIIWADPFARSGKESLTAFLPDNVILAKWRYSGKVDGKPIRKILETGHDVIGCSGICTGYHEHCMQIEERLDDRFDNIDQWEKLCGHFHIGKINTIWGRGTGLWEIYSPWHGHLPVIMYAGNKELWKKHPWYRFFCRLNRVVLRNHPNELADIRERMLTLKATNKLEKQCLDYWILALKYQYLATSARIEHSQLILLRQIKPYNGEDPWVVSKCLENMRKLKAEVDIWESEAYEYFRSNMLSDAEEFISGRKSYLLTLLS